MKQLGLMNRTNKFLKELIKTIQDESTSIAEEGVSSAEYTGFIDTGSYLFNAQLSGTIYGGMPNTKVLTLAGEQSVGKTFLALGIVKQFLENDPDAIVVWYLAEPAVTRQMLIERNIDPNRVVFAEPITVFEWRHHVIKTIDAYMEVSEGDRPKMLMVLDSLGALTTEKELADSTSGSDKRDMTKQQHIRGTFRIIDKKLAKAKVPMILTNHVYQVVGAYVPTKEISGGGGGKYASDMMAVLSAHKVKEDSEVVGNLIKVKMQKNRIAKQHTETELLLSYETGLNRYYGLLELAEKHGIIKKLANRYEFPNGDKAFVKTIYREPEKYFTKEILDNIDAAAKKEYCYGQKQQLDADNEDNTTEPNIQ